MSTLRGTSVGDTVAEARVHAVHAIEASIGDEYVPENLVWLNAEVETYYEVDLMGNLTPVRHEVEQRWRYYL